MTIRSCIAALLVGFQLGCMTPLKPIPAPRDYIEVTRPSRVTITDRQGKTLEVIRPRIISDSLLGFNRMTQEDVWLPFSDVQSVMSRQVDWKKTGLTAVVATAGVVFLASTLAGSGNSSRADEQMEASVILGQILWRIKK